MTDNKKNSSSGNSGLGFFGAIGAFVGRVMSPHEEAHPEPKRKTTKPVEEENVIVIPEGRIKPAMEGGMGFIGGLSELIKEKQRNPANDTTNRLHALQLLYQNENDDGKEKLEEIEAVQSIFEDPGNEVVIENLTRKRSKKADMRKKKTHSRKDSTDSNRTV